MRQAYKKYVNKTVRTAWLKDWTADLLAKLDAKLGLPREEVKAFCRQCKQEYIEEIKLRSEERAKRQGKDLKETSWMNSAANNLSQVRNAIKLWEEEVELTESNSYEQETKDGTVRHHIALMVINFDSEFHKKRIQPTDNKKQEQRRKLTPIENVDLYQALILDLLKSKEWREVAVGIIAAAGRRLSEILKTGQFEQVGQFEVLFSGQTKRGVDDYRTFTLVESCYVCDALYRLRRMPEIKELSRKTLSEVDSGRNSTINRVVHASFSQILPPPVGETTLSTKNLRASYAAIAMYLFCPWEQSESSFIKDRLGHTNDATAASYEDYQVTDNTGKPLTRGAWVERIGEQMTETTQQLVHTSRMLVSKDVRDALSDQDFLPFPDYASRMEELLRLAKIGKQFESGELVKEVVVEKIVEVPVEVKDKAQANKPTPSKTKYDKRPEDMTNEELFGANLPNSGHEKIRRAVAAVKSYNEDRGGDKANMWAINIRTLKDLTNCRTEIVDKYFRSDEGIEELGIRFQVGEDNKTKVIIGYNEMMGLGRYHNRGRGSITEAINLK